MNKYLKYFGLSLYALINTGIFCGAFMFVGDTFINNNLDIKEILFGGALWMLLGKYFLYEIFNSLKISQEVLGGKDEN